MENRMLVVNFVTVSLSKMGQEWFVGKLEKELINYC